MSLRWIACEATTGKIIADLVDLTAGTLKQTIGRYETATVSLPIPTAPDDWQRATAPGYATLIALDGDVPVWGGLVTQRQRSADASGVYTAELSLVTAEGYLDRRYVGDRTYTANNQEYIVAHLAATYAIPGGLLFGTDWAASGYPRDRTYRDDEDGTVYARITQLSGVVDGPEWTMQWGHAASPERYFPTLVVRGRLGAAPLAGLQPNAQFLMPGSVITAATVEDYSAGKGANDVMATGSSQGDMRPTSDHQTLTDLRPKFEFRWSPSSTVTVVDTLNLHAQRALAVLGNGSNAVTLTADSRTAPRLGVDWVLGDDVGYGVEHPAWPDGLAGVGRAIGWERDDTTVTPILAVTELSAGEDA